MKIRITAEDEFSKMYLGLCIGAVFEVLSVHIQTGYWTYRIEVIDSYPHNFQGRKGKIWVSENECEQISGGKTLKQLI